MQKQALDWLSKMWDKADVFGINAPCGSGKSAIARALQIATNGVILTPENMLVKQYLDTYPELNSLIGRAHYRCCDNPEISCEDKYLLEGHHVCDDCTYLKSRRAAVEGKSTIFNPVSYYYASMDKDWKTPDVIIVDESHKLLDTLLLLSGEIFGPTYRPPKVNNLVELTEWLNHLVKLFTELVNKARNLQEAIRFNTNLSKILRIREGIKTNPEQYVYYYENNNLVVMPLTPPKFLLNKVLKAKKVIHMSASLLKFDMSHLTDRPYQYIELDSPIPVERRRVHVDPGIVHFNYKTDPTIIAEWIKKHLNRYPKDNTIVHLTYSWVEKLKPFFPNALFNAPEDKQSVLAKFKRNGGVWLAGGIAEGVDLPDDLCSLNVIPILHLPDRTAPRVAKKLALGGGEREYNINVLRKVQQMAGRTSRHEMDFSRVIIGDRRFLPLVDKYADDFPKSFIESIKR